MPIIGISCCAKTINGDDCHLVWKQYVDAVVRFAHAIPVLVPAIGASTANSALELESLLTRLDGILLTGSRSNVEPKQYGESPVRPEQRHDRDRDATTLPLIRAAVNMGLPIFAICRGAQELNVALGGTLHQELDEGAGVRHRAPEDVPLPDKYLPAHRIRCTPGSWIETLALEAGQDPRELWVNSLHRQAIRAPAARLLIEAIADDGVIEAVRVAGHPFAVGVQWHPEWHFDRVPIHGALFGAFGRACASNESARR